MDPDLAQILHALLHVGGGVFWIVITVLMIPTSAIVLGVMSSVAKAAIKSRDRRFQMRLDAQNAAAGISDNALRELREEIARLRDTTTEHAMSMQHSMERLEQRVEFMERKSVAAQDGIVEPAQPRQQVIGR